MKLAVATRGRPRGVDSAAKGFEAAGYSEFGVAASNQLAGGRGAEGRLEDSAGVKLNGGYVSQRWLCLVVWSIKVRVSNSLQIS